MEGGETMKGKRKFVMTIITCSFALLGLAVLGFIFKDSTSTVAVQLYLVFCLTCVGGLTAFVSGNAFEHYTKMKSGVSTNVEKNNRMGY